MRRSATLLMSGVMIVAAVPAAAQEEHPPPSGGARIGLGAGMGVSAVNASDLAAFVRSLTQQETPEFQSAVEFFGSLGIPVADGWRLKVEYAYLLGAYDVGGGFGQGEFTFTAHLPTLVLQYALAEEERYDVRVGAGAGFSAGRLHARYATLDDAFTGAGPGMKIDLEAHTALGASLFASLGADARWSFIGELRNASGQTPPAVRGAVPPTLHFFSAGVKLGMTWYL